LVRLSWLAKSQGNKSHVALFSDVPARPESPGPGQAEPSQAVKSWALTLGLGRLLARLEISEAVSRGFRPWLFGVVDKRCIAQLQWVSGDL
jgi:hypothetical protein